MDDLGTTEVANDHRMNASPDKRNIYLVDVTFLNNVMVMAGWSRVDGCQQYG